MFKRKTRSCRTCCVLTITVGFYLRKVRCYHFQRKKRAKSFTFSSERFKSRFRYLCPTLFMKILIPKCILSKNSNSVIKVKTGNLFIAIFRSTISFLDLFILKIPTLICNAEFHSFSPLYLDCFFKFSLRKTVEKCVDFVDYLVV